MSAAAAPTGSAATARPIDALLPARNAPAQGETPRQMALRRLKENRLTHVAAIVFTLIVTCSFMAPVFEGYWAGRDAADQNLSGAIEIDGKQKEVVNLQGVPQVGPGMRRDYTLGADPLGRDVFMRILEGGKVSLTVSFGAAAITIGLATLLGTFAGFYRGRCDLVISRYFDMQLAFPTLVLAISLSTALATSDGFLFMQRGSIMLPLVIIGFVSVPIMGRIVRGQVLTLSAREYVEASRALGASDHRIMVKDILPEVSTTIITYFGLMISASIITEAALSFLGVGVLPPTPSWGNIIADGRIFYSTAWWISFFPGLMIMLTVLSLNIMGEALKNAFDNKKIEGGH